MSLVLQTEVSKKGGGYKKGLREGGERSWDAGRGTTNRERFLPHSAVLEHSLSYVYTDAALAIGREMPKGDKRTASSAKGCEHRQFLFELQRCRERRCLGKPQGKTGPLGGVCVRAWFAASR